MSRRWRYLDTGPNRGAMNMAIDEAMMIALSRGLAPPTLRVYRWDPPAISIGYFQRLSEEVDEGACRRNGIEIVRRPTGGRAVLHHHEVTYSILFKEGDSPAAGGVMRTYKELSRGILRGLNLLGVEAEMVMGRVKAGHLHGACFDAPSWCEIAVNGRKLVGSAQLRRGGVILQHGSILLRNDVDLLFSLLRPAGEAWTLEEKDAFSRKVISLAEVMGKEPSSDEVAKALARGMSEVLAIELEYGEMTVVEAELASGLVATKYGADEWLRWR